MTTSMRRCSIRIGMSTTPTIRTSTMIHGMEQSRTPIRITM
jgi:hypothetical protein